MGTTRHWTEGESLRRFRGDAGGGDADIEMGIDEHTSDVTRK
jgi:hypothetical protein